jgi:hypothetical protein
MLLIDPLLKGINFEDVLTIQRGINMAEKLSNVLWPAVSSEICEKCIYLEIID